MKSKDQFLEISLPDKVVKLKGHQDKDAFRVYTESLETHPNLTDKDKELIRDKISKDPNIIVD